MKGRVIALDVIGARRVAALIEDGVLQDLLVSTDEPLAPGAICRAICTRPMKGQGGMMVELPGGARGYLRRGRGLASGQALLVQVTGRGGEAKALPVSDRILFKSRLAIVTPGAPGINLSRRIRDEDRRETLLALGHEIMDGPAGLILRSAAADADADAIARDIAAMRDLAASALSDADGAKPALLVEGPDAHLLAWRDWPAPDLLAEAPGGFAEHGVDDMIATILAPRQALKGGGFAHIEPTRALVAVDVNTGADTSRAAGLKANLALASDLPRLLRCRGLGGQIVIDFAPMPKRDRGRIEQVLRAGFRRDPVETALAGWTPLGHFELQRKHARLPVPGDLAR